MVQYKMQEEYLAQRQGICLKAVVTTNLNDINEGDYNGNDN